MAYGHLETIFFIQKYNHEHILIQEQVTRGNGPFVYITF